MNHLTRAIANRLKTTRTKTKTKSEPLFNQVLEALRASHGAVKSDDKGPQCLADILKAQACCHHGRMLFDGKNNQNLKVME